MSIPVITDNFVLFWGDANFSNFARAEFTLDGFTFTSSEQAYMFYKACYFDDEQSAISIMAAQHPAECKRIGRRVKGFNYTDWMKVSLQVMKRVVYAKFSQNPSKKELLLATGDRILAEASPKDFFWGIGLKQDHVYAESPEKWSGKNYLGIILMEVRDELRDE